MNINVDIAAGHRLQLLAIAVICRDSPHRQVCASRLRHLRRAHTQFLWGFRLRASREGIAVPKRVKVLPAAVYAVDIYCILHVMHDIHVSFRRNSRQSRSSAFFEEEKI